MPGSDSLSILKLAGFFRPAGFRTEIRNQLKTENYPGFFLFLIFYLYIYFFIFDFCIYKGRTKAEKHRPGKGQNRLFLFTSFADEYQTCANK
jgi:hypothetical protein